MNSVRTSLLTAGLLLCSATLAVAQTSTTTTSPQTATAAPQEDLTVRDWLKRPELFGDWGGKRKTMFDKGLKVDASWTQFFASAPNQSPLGDDHGFDYGGKFDLKLTGDLSKLGDGLTTVSTVEFRYGDTTLLAGGTLLPTNTALLIPESDGEAVKITSLYLSKEFGRTVLQAGRFNTVHRYQKPFTGGAGVDKFMNVAFAAQPLLSRTTPFVVEGVFVTYLKNLEPFVTAGLIESTDEGFFDNGATVFGSLALPFKPLANPGHYVVTATVSSIEATSLDQTPYALIPAFGVEAETEQSAWTLDVTFDQYVSFDPKTGRGWGFFGSLGVSDANPSLLDLFAHFGAGGTGFWSSRSQDTWGVGYYVAGVSNTFRESLSPFVRLRNEGGGEVYYNFAITGWSTVAADLQFIDPFAVGSKTRTFFSVRWKLNF